MLLPNADKVIIDAAKLRDYLLSTTHPLGRFKARFFGALGFSADRWLELESAIRTQHLTQEAESLPAMRSGQKFTIRAGETAPRFVTAYPVLV